MYTFQRIGWTYGCNTNQSLLLLLTSTGYDQYTYHDNDTDSLATPVINYYGGIYIRKRVNGNHFDIDRSANNGIDWTMIGRIGGTVTSWRYGVVGGLWVAQQNDGGWETRGAYGGSGVRTEFRDGVRNGEFVVDKALTATGFSGTEGVDWVNIGGYAQP